MKTVYGPVPSWRLGRSLGIDPVCTKRKICSFDCVYCQLGKTLEKTDERREFVKTDVFEKDLTDILKSAKADMITFSGTAEPTLAANLSDMLEIIREHSMLPVAILTNSSFLPRKEVRQDLSKFDEVVAKLDAPNQEIFMDINKPHETIGFRDVVSGIREFRKTFRGKLALQMMFMDSNENYAKEMVKLADSIDADEIQVNTPLRPCVAKPLSKERLKEIAELFTSKNVVCVYDAKKPKVEVDDMKELKKRRPVL